MNENINFEKNVAPQRSMELSQYIAKVFGCMCAGLMVTFVTAMVLAVSGLSLIIFSNSIVSIGLMFAQIGVVMFLSTRLNKITVKSATTLFFTYSLLTGITFSGIFYIYGLGNVIGIFLLTSLYFGALACYGLFTKADLSKMGTFLIISVVFLIIGSIMTMFFPMPMLDRILCIAGVIVFLCFTAYDTQKISAYYHSYQGDEAMLGKVAIVSALQLYLDFINIFIYLLRFFSNNND